MYWRRTGVGALPAEPATYDPDHSRSPPVVPDRSGKFLSQPAGGTPPMRLLARREIATAGGKFTSRCTWLASPLYPEDTMPASTDVLVPA